MNKKSEVRAVVLAAGAGTRLDPLTRRVPKPLVAVANRPVMEYTLRLLKRHGINKVAANLFHLAELIPAYFDNLKGLDITINYVKEEKLSGDAGGVRACRKFLDGGTFVVIMGDVITDVDLSSLIERHRKSKAIVTIALKQVEDVKHFGVVALDEKGFVKAFQEKPQAEEAISNLASTGIYICEPEIFKHIPQDGQFGFGHNLFPKLLELGLPIQGVEVNCYWSDIGTIPAYRQACFDAISGKVELDLPGEVLDAKSELHGVKIEGDGHLLLGRNVVLGEGIVVKGNVVVGDNCMIGSGAKLEDSIVWSDSTLAANSVIKRAVVADGCHLRSFSRWADVVIAESLPGAPTAKTPRILGRSKSKRAFAS